jgi:LPS O-antigen subunit length determinant protein (WzzB/FepE family)
LVVCDDQGCAYTYIATAAIHSNAHIHQPTNHQNQAPTATKTNLAELDARISGGELAERSLEQVVVERHQHDVEALLRELLGYGLADAFFVIVLLLMIREETWIDQ